MLEDLLRIFSFQDLNTRVVLAGTTLLGTACGAIGTFTLLRQRALVGDALSHAALPGVCLAFLILGQKSFAGLLFGALVSGTAGVLVIYLVSRYTRVSEDASIGIVLSTFFGFGITLSRLIQNDPQGNKSGIETFIYGKAASMLTADAWMMLCICLGVLIVLLALFKELTLVCFDPDFARTAGWPVGALDLLLMAVLVVTTIAGLQAVGVVLIIALLITPSAAARFWTDDIKSMMAISCFFGGSSAFIGTVISGVSSRIATGPMIVLTAALIFVISLLFGSRGGVLARFYSGSVASMESPQ